MEEVIGVKASMNRGGLLAVHRSSRAQLLVTDPGSLSALSPRIYGVWWRAGDTRPFTG